MVREIKLRAWDKGEMVIADRLNFTDHGDGVKAFILDEVVRECGGDIHHDLVWVELEGPVMQFTGLHDRHGKEIYEGDVVNFAIKVRRCDCDGETELLSTSKFCPSCGKRVELADFIQVAEVKYHKAGYSLFYTRPECNYSWSYHAAENFIAWIEVIGNIYESPELLTQPTTV
jgi:uncharacterized phage protein (TIGR01671 family)